MADKPLDPANRAKMRAWSVSATNGCPTWADHDFKEVYYGHECTKCGLFFAFGCAPWDPEESDNDIGESLNDA